MVDGRWESRISAMGRESQNKGCKTPSQGFYQIGIEDSVAGFPQNKD